MKTETEKPKETKFQIAYNELNESKKARLRADFLSEMGYTSFDTFYKKLRGESEIYINEKKWFAERMQTVIEQLF